MSTNPEHPNPQHPGAEPGGPHRRAQPERPSGAQLDDDRLDEAFGVFGALPGVSTDPDERLEQFVDAWAGSWTDPAQMTRDLSGIGAVEDALDQLRLDAPTGDFIRIDYQALDQLVTERWTITERNGTFHVFEK